MKKLIILIIASFLYSTYSAQDTPNLSGLWQGYRLQFDKSKKKYVSEYEYTYSLSQIGNKVLGVANIKNKQGNYADIAVRGFIADNKFYFEEYEILNASRSNGFLWCLKQGVLEIVKKDYDETILKGKTPSVTEEYKTDCNGGFSYMTRKIERLNEGVISSLLTPDSVEKALNIEIYPNPFITNTTISFKLNTSEKVILDILDINGNVVTNLVNANLNAGTYPNVFTPLSSNTNLLFYYMRLRIGANTYSRMIQRN